MQILHAERLNEISKVAALKASSSLSKLIKHPVGIEISPIMTLKSDVLPMDAKLKEEMVGLFAKVSGDLTGVSLFYIPKESALAMCDLLLDRKPNETKSFEELEISALLEVANIVIGNFLTPFAYPLKLDSVMHHVPDFKCASHKEMLEHIAKKAHEISSANDKLMVEILITLQHLKIKGFLVFMLDYDEMKKALTR